MRFAYAAQLIVEHGHHRHGFWPGSHDVTPTAWRPGTPLDVFGALAVACGLTAGGPDANTVMTGPMLVTLRQCLPDRHLAAGVNVYNDGSGWLTGRLGDTAAARWWLRRRTVRLLRDAASRCRRDPHPTAPQSPAP